MEKTSATELELSELVLSFFVSPYLAATCSVLHDVNSRHALIVDPGLETAEEVLAYLEKHSLVAQGILLSHGHLDHVADASRLASTLNIPVVSGAKDAYRLDNPIEQLPAAFTGQIAPLLEQRGWQRPKDLQLVEPVRSSLLGQEAAKLSFGSFQVLASQYPGHTEGSTLYAVSGKIKVEPLVGVSPRALHVEQVLFTGDVLFAGTIGRTDLPGGDPAEMKETLAKLKLEALANPETLIVPGHGAASTLGQELVDNRFLQMFG